MKTRLLTNAALGAALLSAVGCAHTGLGQPPLETDLANDGTAQSQQALVKEYRVEFKSGMINRPGGDPHKVGVDQLTAKASSAEASAYLDSSERAAKKTQSAAIGFDRVVSSTEFGNALMLTIAVAGAVFGAVVAVPGIVNAATGPSKNSWDFTASLGTLGWSMLGGAFGGCLASIPFTLLNAWLVVPLADAVAAPDYQKATSAFNKDLDERVRKAARPAAASQPAGSEPPAEPAPPTAPAPASAPAGGGAAF
jgi:hypothetical protein